MLRQVIDGERLSGHRNSIGEYPEICVSDGRGPGSGSLMFSIESFHWADVAVKGDTTELWFENKLCLAIPDGVVQYAE